ncbi:hypothetical protein pdam_00002946 [Pocillopora damicornis]|uniref:Uncharacterized protein n=2 Tax=Pocillopora TaxID=46730 RepID=A0A3M6U8U5_POCDA|nr:uncharacterized protein LOC113667177 [Pocillopora damicornis]RMX50105.1 hypothetical protein pdam_00002946 [Pocillopora damicornis]CAH3152007.1 unnamed protein product [Pocillopora meandrina]
MKVSIFLVTFSLAVFCISAYAFNTEEHVKRFFRPEHRHLLPETTSLQLLDEPRRALLPQHDESTQCLAACEKNCEKIEVEDFLTKAENFRKFEFDDVAADCVLASTVVFAKPPYKCDWLELYQFDCCRACNAQFEKCNKDVRRIPGGPEFCYRKQYKCQCDCLNKHRPVENSEQIKP